MGLAGRSVFPREALEKSQAGAIQVLVTRMSNTRSLKQHLETEMTSPDSQKGWRPCSTTPQPTQVQVEVQEQAQRQEEVC